MTDKTTKEDTKELYLRIHYDGSVVVLTHKEAAHFFDDIPENELCDYSVEFIRMSEDEYNKLPEFQGF